MFESVTAAMCNDVLREITNLIPVVLPATIGFIAFRKGFSFLKSALRSA